MTAHIITIGDEILIGQIIDTNSAWMGEQLNLCGVEVTAIKTIPDQWESIQEAIRQSMKEADLVLTTGGLGATKDDITKKAIADLLDTELYLHQELYDRAHAAFVRRGLSIQPESLRKQCMMPHSATLLPNEKGLALGMWFEQEGKVLVSMPGVPYEMKYIMEHQALPRIREGAGLRPICHRTLLTSGYGETDLASRIEHILDAMPPYMKMAYLPNLGEVRLRLSAFGTAGMDIETLQAEVDAGVDKIKEVLGLIVYGEGRSDLQQVVGEILREKGLQIGVAESCTGGRISAQIVEVPGSSHYFKGGIIAYSNELKIKQLGVTPQTLEAYGAVSERTVREMVTGCLKALEVDVAIAISGIAGPTGGSEEKPVGTVWIAIGDANRTEAYRLRIGRDRLQNIGYASKRALHFLRLFLLE